MASGVLVGAPLRNQPRMDASIRVSPEAFWEGRRRDSEDIISIVPFAASVCFLLLVLSKPCCIFIQCRYIRGYIASRVCLQPFASDHLL